MAAAPPPKFTFHVQPVRPNNNRSSGDKKGAWLPPRKLGNNVAAGDGDWFYCDGQQIRQIRRTDFHEPFAGNHHKTFTLYHWRDTIWATEGNAINRQVGDGKEETSGVRNSNSGGSSSSAATTDDPLCTDWERIGFHYIQWRYGGSRITVAGDQTRLFWQRREQTWARVILPTNLQAPDERQEPPRDPPAPSRGGLIGDLGLILGLMALAVPPDDLVSMFERRMIQGRWQFGEDEPGGHTRIDGRGLVVSVYSVPGEPTDAVQSYEEGYRGAILD